MRSFITATLILLSMTVLIVFNSIYITKKTDKLLDICTKIENGSLEPETLASSWQDCRDIISMSVIKTELDGIEDALCRLLSETDTSERLIALCQFKKAVARIADSQKPTADNIF